MVFPCLADKVRTSDCPPEVCSLGISPQVNWPPAWPSRKIVVIGPRVSHIRQSHHRFPRPGCVINSRTSGRCSAFSAAHRTIQFSGPVLQSVQHRQQIAATPCRSRAAAATAPAQARPLNTPQDGLLRRQRPGSEARCCNWFFTCVRISTSFCRCRNNCRTSRICGLGHPQSGKASHPAADPECAWHRDGRSSVGRNHQTAESAPHLRSTTRAPSSASSCSNQLRVAYRFHPHSHRPGPLQCLIRNGRAFSLLVLPIDPSQQLARFRCPSWRSVGSSDENHNPIIFIAAPSYRALVLATQVYSLGSWSRTSSYNQA